MQYDLAVLRADEILATERVVVANVRELWTRVAKAAEGVDQPGSRIRVTEEAGGIAILIGAAAARRLSASAIRPRTVAQPRARKAVG